MSKPSIVSRLEKEAPVLQVALDFTSLEDALGLAAELRRSLDTLWLAEAGTPLIKSEGLRSVALLARVAKPNPVAADMKTADTGALEAGLAARAGASIVTVLACSLDETIAAAAREAHRYGAAVAADLIAVRDPVARAEQLASLGVDIVELHVGIDAQKALGMTAAELQNTVKKIAERFPGLVAVAGGLNAKTAPAMVEAGAVIVIVGGAITRSEDPVASAKAVIEAIKRSRA
ncbi:orotidine 5'-phosphate decarboxylase / HUMPS family protein [Pyrodictium abyssi]|uniref:3-hexulose-6-phosphate synthase n=1 Tax=Pyrodictium abyssi TaxID=54256 RepID=A0ABM8IXI2_9CREN|nr:3-hexulose-6-phosphate synthase [Pyrodictium abyssi]